MLGRKVTPEQRDQLARQALKEIAAFRARMARQAQLAPPGPLDRLVLKACRAFLDRWERQEQRALLDQQARPAP